jgi:potassium-transporting ATPase KdpC subunit
MLKEILRTLRPACLMLLALSLLTGLAYPAAITLAAKALFPQQAEGSLIVENGVVIGSELLGQQFSAPGRFWGRPSATAPQPYNAAASGGSNLSPEGKAQLKAVQERVDALRAADQMGYPETTAPIPADLLTASASGLDPHISPAAAQYQIPRVARERGLAEDRVRALVLRRTEGRTLGFLGEPRVNVLLLNRALDELGREALASQGASAHNAEVRQ